MKEKASWKVLIIYAETFQSDSPTQDLKDESRGSLYDSNIWPEAYESNSGRASTEAFIWALGTAGAPMKRGHKS